MQESNATITSATIGLDRGTLLSAWLNLDYGGTCQGFGGYCFDTPIKDKDGKFIRREGVAWGAEYIRRVLEVVGVERWDQLEGRNIRVLREDGWQGKVKAIGHIIKDKWFDPEADLAHLLPKEATDD